MERMQDQGQLGELNQRLRAVQKSKDAILAKLEVSRNELEELHESRKALQAEVDNNKTQREKFQTLIEKQRVKELELQEEIISEHGETPIMRGEAFLSTFLLTPSSPKAAPSFTKHSTVKGTTSVAQKMWGALADIQEEGGHSPGGHDGGHSGGHGAGHGFSPRRIAGVAEATRELKNQKGTK